MGAKVRRAMGPFQCCRTNVGGARPGGAKQD